MIAAVNAILRARARRAARRALEAARHDARPDARGGGGAHARSASTRSPGSRRAASTASAPRTTRVAAAASYAAALGIDHHEALELARPCRCRRARRDSAALPACSCSAGSRSLLLAARRRSSPSARWLHRQASSVAAAALGREAAAAPWSITVDVLNGAGDIDYTRSVADRVTALGYASARDRARRPFDYPRDGRVLPAARRGVGARLAKSLCVGTKPLPGGTTAAAWS